MHHYTEYLEQAGHKKYRIAQVDQAVYKDFVSSFDEISTLPLDLRSLLSSNLSFSPLVCLREKTSSDGTVKVLLETHDGHKIESVLMRHKNNRNTVCVSSQVGCAVACSFCSTGKLGLKRNLTHDEIVSQVVYFQRKLHETNERVTNIVFMGMGEPFHNYETVIEAMKTMNNPKKIGIGIRHITISTSGIVPMIRRFADEGHQANLAISLHAPSDGIRSSIMPLNDRYPLEELMDAIQYYGKTTGRRIFYEYTMLKRVNDSVSTARLLGALVQGTNAHVNLIPYNPGATDTYSSSDVHTMREFQRILEGFGVPSTIRTTLGQDIDGACGQLAAKN